MGRGNGQMQIQTRSGTNAISRPGRMERAEFVPGCQHLVEQLADAPRHADLEKRTRVHRCLRRPDPEEQDVLLHAVESADRTRPAAEVISYRPDGLRAPRDFPLLRRHYINGNARQLPTQSVNATHGRDRQSGRRLQIAGWQPASIPECVRRAGCQSDEDPIAPMRKSTRQHWFRTAHVGLGYLPEAIGQDRIHCHDDGRRCLHANSFDNPNNITLRLPMD